MKNETQKKNKEDKPVIAICYDFDKTLTPDDMQAQGYIQAVKCDVGEFWKESNDLAAQNDMDQNLAYMFQMNEKAKGKVLFTKQTLEENGAKVRLFPGVEDWFDRIKAYGIKKGVIVEHYIISSGLKEMIEGTVVAKNGAFEKIYASSFYYDKDGVAVWPAQVVNYTNKTQFLFRIEKGVLDINDQSVNDYFAPEDIRVPFGNMIYIGDSDTDIPCMKLVTANGGYSIGVYNEETADKTKVYKMMREGRIKYFAAANYSENSELDSIVKAIIDRTITNHIVENLHFRCKKETIENDKSNGEAQIEKMDLIISLENSRNFASTHSIVKKLSLFKDWTEDELNTIFDIAVNNSQVFYILNDIDIKLFFIELLKIMKNLSDNARKVKEIINDSV